VFTHEVKPLEIEILVAEVGAEPGDDQLFHILYDGSIVDEDRYTVLGGEAEAIAGRLEQGFQAGWALDAALERATFALAGEGRELSAAELEVAVLARSNGRRAFRRVDDAEAAALLGQPPPPANGTGSAQDSGGEGGPGHKDEAGSGK
jgi:proteasome alpha subunit